MPAKGRLRGPEQSMRQMPAIVPADPPIGGHCDSTALEHHRGGSKVARTRANLSAWQTLTLPVAMLSVLLARMP